MHEASWGVALLGSSCVFEGFLDIWGLMELESIFMSQLEWKACP